jgi:acyl CoA:acetate/3-ketoacid CoA transferase alpha subunit
MSKVMTAEQTVRRFVANGFHVAMGGCLYSRTPTAVINEIIRQKLLDLTMSRSLTGMERRTWTQFHCQAVRHRLCSTVDRA